MFEEIRSLLSPPETPRRLDRSWHAVETEIGLTLPETYKTFIDIYGSGQITSSEGWVNVWNFRDASIFNPPLNEMLSGVVNRNYRPLDSTDFRCPYPTYPEPGGLLPVACICDIHYLNWLTEGPPSQWPLVYYFFDGIEFNCLEGDSFASCILKMLQQKYSGLGQPSNLEPPYEFVVSESSSPARIGEN